MKARLKLKTPVAAVTVPVAVVEPASCNLLALGVRWRGGEKIGVLAREAGMSWNKLWSELEKLGYRPRPSDNSDPDPGYEPPNCYVPGAGWCVV